MKRNHVYQIQVLQTLLLWCLLSVPTLSQESATPGLGGEGDLTLVSATPVPDEPCSGTTLSLRLDKEGGGQINGPVCVTGVPSFSGGSIGDVSWTVSGSAISGAVKGDNGQTLATFAGSAGEEGVSGTFTTAGGRSGSWRWDGETAVGQ